MNNLDTQEQLKALWRKILFLQSNKKISCIKTEKRTEEWTESK